MSTALLRGLAVENICSLQRHHGLHRVLVFSSICAIWVFCHVSSCSLFIQVFGTAMVCNDRFYSSFTVWKYVWKCACCSHPCVMWYPLFTPLCVNEIICPPLCSCFGAFTVANYLPSSLTAAGMLHDPSVIISIKQTGLEARVSHDAEFSPYAMLPFPV